MFLSETKAVQSLLYEVLPGSTAHALRVTRRRGAKHSPSETMKNQVSQNLGPAVNRQPGHRRGRLAELTNKHMWKEQPTKHTNHNSNHQVRTTKQDNTSDQQTTSNKQGCSQASNRVHPIQTEPAQQRPANPHKSSTTPKASKFQFELNKAETNLPTKDTG